MHSWALPGADLAAKLVRFGPNWLQNHGRIVNHRGFPEHMRMAIVPCRLPPLRAAHPRGREGQRGGRPEPERQQQHRAAEVETAEDEGPLEDGGPRDVVGIVPHKQGVGKFEWR